MALISKQNASRFDKQSWVRVGSRYHLHGDADMEITRRTFDTLYRRPTFGDWQTRRFRKYDRLVSFISRLPKSSRLYIIIMADYPAGTGSDGQPIFREWRNLVRVTGPTIALRELDSGNAIQILQATNVTTWEVRWITDL